MPRYFRRLFSAAFSTWRGCRFPWFPVVSGGLWVCFPGLPSGPQEALVCPVSGASPTMLPRGGGVPLRASRKAGPEGCFFALFARRFPVRRGAPETPGRGETLPDREKRTCVKKVRGGIQLRVVGFTRSALCNERSFRTDVSICTMFSYGSARAGV